MSLEIIIGIAGLTLTIVLYILDKIINGSSRASKKYLINKWLDVKNKNLNLQTTIYIFSAIDKQWSSLAFPDGNITFKDYYLGLEERYNSEYSDVQLKRLKKAKLSKYEIDEYVTKLRVQEDSINLLQHSVDLQIKKWNPQY